MLKWIAQYCTFANKERGNHAQENNHGGRCRCRTRAGLCISGRSFAAHIDRQRRHLQSVHIPWKHSNQHRPCASRRRRLQPLERPLCRHLAVQHQLAHRFSRRHRLFEFESRMGYLWRLQGDDRQIRLWLRRGRPLLRLPGQLQYGDRAQARRHRQGGHAGALRCVVVEMDHRQVFLQHR